MVSSFNQTIINILCNFVLHEVVLFDDRDPPWMNKEIKKMIHEKKNIFNCFRRNNNDKRLFDRLKYLQVQLNFPIEKSKGKYYSRLTSKLSDIGKSSKAYWVCFLEVFFLTFQKHLIKSRTMVLYSNYKKMEYREAY